VDSGASDLETPDEQEPDPAADLLVELLDAAGGFDEFPWNCDEGATATK
jgi:hypothetical protein